MEGTLRAKNHGEKSVTYAFWKESQCGWSRVRKMEDRKRSNQR